MTYTVPDLCITKLRPKVKKKLQLHEEILVQTCPGLWCVILTNWHAHNASLAGTIFFALISHN